MEWTSNRNHICSTLLRNKESNFKLILWGKTRNVNRGKYNNPKFILIWSRNCAIEFVQQNPPTVVPQPMLQSDKEFEKQILASLNQNRVRAKNVSGIFINVFLILIKLSIKTYCDYYIVDFGYVSVTSNSCQEIYFRRITGNFEIFENLVNDYF